MKKRANDYDDWYTRKKEPERRYRGDQRYGYETDGAEPP